MEKIVLFHQDQQVTDEDLANIGVFGRESLDHVVADMLEPGAKFSGFIAVESGPAQVTVGAGRLVANGGKIYGRYDEGGVTLDLLARLPVLARKIVTIIAYGQQADTALEATTFLTDVETEATEARPVPTENRRTALIDIVPGLESSDPKPPALDANYLAIAYVVLSPSGIESVTRATENLMGSVRDATNRIADLETWRQRAGSRLDTLDTGLAGINASLSGLAKLPLVASLARDVSRLAVRAKLPATYTSYGADDFVSTAFSDTAHAAYDAKIDYGLHFPNGARTVGTLALLNPIDPSVTVQANFVMPKWVDVERVALSGQDGEISLSSYQHQTTKTVQKMRSRTEWVRAPNVDGQYYSQAIQNNLGDYFAGSMSLTSLIRLGDEELQLVGLNPNDPIDAQASPAQVFRRYVKVTTQEPYWDTVTVEENVSGSVVAQSFLNGEDGYLTAVGIPFTKVGGAGDVTVIVAETLEGRPDIGKVIARANVPAADLRTLPTKVKAKVPPTLLLKGRRYGIFFITSGAHFLATVDGKKDINGNLWYGLDGAVVQGDLTRDIPISLFFAQFATPRLEVQLNPLELAGGIVGLKINVDKLAPAGTVINFETQVGGVWYPVTGEGANAFPANATPNIMQLRAVLTGTTDLMPGFGIGPLSETIVDYPKLTRCHVSKAWTLPAPATKIEVFERLAFFVEAKHNADAKVLVGAGFVTIETPDAITDDLTAEPGVIVRRYVFNLAAAVSTFKIRLDGQMTNALEPFSSREAYWIAYA